MKDFRYVIENFFTHQDYLVSPELIPGTIWTPLHFVFEGTLLAFIIISAVYLSKHKKYIKPVFKTIWVILIVWEIIITLWDNYAGKTKVFNLSDSLPLYPCSIIMYTLPIIIWSSNEIAKKIAYGYVFTLGLLGAVVNFVIPTTRLVTYSCISFPGLHTFFFHGSILFIFLVLILSGEHSYRNIHCWWELLLPSAASLVFSIPSNIINYSPINADYMYFTGQFFALQKIFHNFSRIEITLILYVLYIAIPALFYLPSYIHNNKFVKKVIMQQKEAFALLFSRSM